MEETEIVDQEQVGNEKECGLWSELPDVILCEIFSRLYAGDRVVFRSICKSWNSVSPFVTSPKFQFGQHSECSYPYLMFSNNRIFHPIYEECYHVGTKDAPGEEALFGMIYEKFHHMDFLDIPGASVRVAKDGWLLMTIGMEKIFFYNPLTKEKVQLPDLDAMPDSLYFSSPPTSTDWLVIVGMQTNFNDIAIQTLKCGEARWSSCEYFLNEVSFQFSFCNAVFFEGLYYFLGKNAKLLIHDPCKRKFYFQTAPKSLQLIASNGEQYMLVSNGKLLAVFEGCDGNSVRVFQWNHCKKTWETLSSLGIECSL